MEHIDRILFLPGFHILSHRWPETYWWKLLSCAALLWLLVAVGYSFGLPDITENTVSLHGLLYIGPLARLLEFASGMAVCLLYKWLLPKLVKFSTAIFTCVELMVLALVGFVACKRLLMGVWLEILIFKPVAVQYAGHADSWPAFALMILVFAFQKGLVSRFLSLKFPVLLGEASYSLYLVHQMVFHVIYNKIGATGWSAFIVGFAASQATAFALWFIVENPARRYVKHLLSKPARAPYSSRVILETGPEAYSGTNPP